MLARIGGLVRMRDKPDSDYGSVIRVWNLLLVLGLLIVSGGAFGANAVSSWDGGGAGMQVVRVEVATQERSPDMKIVARTMWLGDEMTVELSDNGTVFGDHASDGVWVAEFRGAAVRELPIRFWVTMPGQEAIMAGGGVEPLQQDTDIISYVMEVSPLGTPSMYRVAATLPGPTLRMAEAAGIAALLGWIALAFGYVAWLTKVAMRERSEVGGPLPDGD